MAETTLTEKTSDIKRRSQDTMAGMIWNRFRKHPSALIGAILLAGATGSQVIKYIRYKQGNDVVEVADLRRTEI